MKKLCSFTLFAVLVILLNACGGGGGSDTPQGIEGTGRFISGPIDSYEEGLEGNATITVNGTRFTIPNDTNFIDTQSNLVEGQVVLVTEQPEADDTTGTPEQIDIIVNVRGPISQINPLINTLIVLGQTIVLSNETEFGDGINLDLLQNLPLNTNVQVSGLSTANGQIIATRIDIIELLPGDELSVLGQVSELNLEEQHFMINDLLVDFSAANIDLNNLATLQNDLTVFITGNLTNTLFSANNISGLRLSSIVQEGATIDIEALISRFESAQDFTINGINVITNNLTTYTNGEQADLDVNSSIRVVGIINSDGVLVANSIEFIPLNIDILVTAPVENIELAQNNVDTPNVIGNLQLLGLTMQVNTMTEFDDITVERSINTNDFNSIQINDTLDVRGIFDGKDILLTRITRIPATPSVRLRGLVNTTSNILLIVQGVQVRLSPQTTQFIGTNGRVINYFDFIAQAPGHAVFVEGVNTNGIIDADSIQLIASPNGSILIGTPASDRLIGTDRDDIILGGADDDQLIGGAGDDILRGGPGSDFIEGNAGNDELYGDDGFDTLVGSLGTDLLDGGAGGNLATYGRSPVGVTISLDGSVGQGGHAEGDTLSNIDSLDGTPFDDILSGSNRGGHLRGFAGNDTLSANTGNVELDGGTGNDTLNGSDDGDHLFGGEGDDELFGNDGGDYLNGGPGADLIDGGANTTGGDIVDYSNSPSGIRLSIDGTPASGGDAEGDILTNIENIFGSNFADEITGDHNNNIIDGREGNDILNGGAGSDSLGGNRGNDILNGGSGNDIFFFHRDGGLDIIETASNSTDEDRVNFESNITPQDLWFSESGDDLHITIIGTADRLTITDWQNNSITSYLSDNQLLLHANVQALIDAMTVVVPVEGEVLIISTSILNSVANTIDTNWN